MNDDIVTVEQTIAAAPAAELMFKLQCLDALEKGVSKRNILQENTLDKKTLKGWISQEEFPAMPSNLGGGSNEKVASVGCKHNANMTNLQQKKRGAQPSSMQMWKKSLVTNYLGVVAHTLCCAVSLHSSVFEVW